MDGDHVPKGNVPNGSASKGRDANDARKCIMMHPRIPAIVAMCRTLGIYICKTINKKHITLARFGFVWALQANVGNVAGQQSINIEEQGNFCTKHCLQVPLKKC